LEDINEALELIEEYVINLDFTSWTKDRKNIQKKIPWSQMKGMRNLLIHEYFGVDSDVLWRTIQEDLPPFKIQIIEIISETKRGI
jgi:uncharacterized protein with HEPN domain